jgi:hypothetical protein
MSASTPPLIAPVDLWATQVAAYATFPDQRLNTRWADVLACLAAKPADSIPQASRDCSQAKATYRFLENDRVKPEALLMSFVRATVQACRGLSVVYAVHDSTSFNYSSLKQTTGLGLLNDIENARGIHLHTTLALRPDGVAVGLLHQQYWVRPPGEKKVPPQQRRIEDRESYKWLAGLTATATAFALLPAPARPRLIHVMDREGDIHEVLEQVAGSGDSAVIRCCYNRRVVGTPNSAHDAVRAAPLLGHTTVAVKTSDKQPARKAKLALRSLPLVLEPSYNVDRRREPVAYTLVEAREVDFSPEVSEPLHWFLWTLEPATTLAEVQAVLSIYQLRPRIEDYHLTLKSGCRVERLELETVERLRKALVAYSGIAVRIVSLRDLARQEPEASCTQVLGEDEWQALWTHFTGQVPAARTRPPTTEQVVRWLGRLGGHLGRKRDGMPGVRTLWRGWRDLQLLVAGYRAGKKCGAGR